MDEAREHPPMPSPPVAPAPVGLHGIEYEKVSKWRLMLSFIIGSLLIAVGVYFVGIQATAAVKSNGGDLHVNWPEVALILCFIFPGISLLFPRRAKSMGVQVIEAWRAKDGGAGGNTLNVNVGDGMDF